ncbi:hypothetical protein [Sphingobium sp. Z007]|uniref:hypothetical protein n=1 Tax=Sphingobium sp. Z007 TaxID=627495 RepID=UPI000B4A0011|nr:hypothetical protein [Sphingobium sp. Z007]
MLTDALESHSINPPVFAAMKSSISVTSQIAIFLFRIQLIWERDTCLAHPVAVYWALFWGREI